MHTDTEGNKYYMLIKPDTKNAGGEGVCVWVTIRCMYVVSAHNKDQVIVNDDHLQAKLSVRLARTDWKEKVDAGWKRERNPTPKDMEEMGKNI